MATVTWKGEPGPGDDAGPLSVTCGNRVFKKGEAVEITDPAVLEMAKSNPFFEVSGTDEATPQARGPSLLGSGRPVPKV